MKELGELVRELRTQLASESAKIVQGYANEILISLPILGYGVDDVEVTISHNLVTISGSRDRYTNFNTRQIVIDNEYLSFSSWTAINGFLLIALNYSLPERYKPRRVHAAALDGFLTAHGAFYHD